MSKLYKILLLAMSLVLISCGSSEDNNQTRQNERQKTEVTEKAEVKSETAEVKSETTEVKDDLKDDPWIKDASYDKNVTDDELEWINKVTKLIADKDSREILKILGGSAKEFVNGDALKLDPAYDPLSLSGKIKKIINIKKERGTDNGADAYLYSVLTEGEDKNLIFKIARNVADELVTFQLIIEGAEQDSADEDSEYMDFVEYAYTILENVSTGNFDYFETACKDMEATPEEIKNIYEEIKNVFDKAGEITDNSYNVGALEMSTLYGDPSLTGYAIQVYVRLFPENTQAIDFNLYFDEEMNLITLNYQVY